MLFTIFENVLYRFHFVQCSKQSHANDFEPAGIDLNGEGDILVSY